ASAGAVTYATFLSPEQVAVDWTGVVGIPMSRLLRELLLHNQNAEMAAEARLRLQRVGVDLIRPVRTVSLDIPLPKTPELLTIAERIIADPA
ncbi:AraC family transcriptional regulator, partial [Streptomyces sp. SID7499]|nr:AraC family transcriptional regulator [Streptomyces sp. SID7499]